MESFSSRVAVESLSFLVVGLARNCEKTIREDVSRIQTAISRSGSVSWMVIESDSSDGTVSKLRELSSEVRQFDFVSLGHLEPKLKKRTERIAYCRNYYTQLLRSTCLASDVDYVVVADLDGVNSQLTPRAFESCWERTDWDMCAANQNGPYYDIWALRHKDWCPGDCWSQHAFLAEYSSDNVKNLWASVYSKMITIPPSSQWIEVNSAFGGLAIYKRYAFDECEYKGLTEDGVEVCEHVHFNAQFKSTGARLFINPKLINAGLTEHTRPLLFRNRFKQWAKGRLKRLSAWTA